MKTEHNIRDDLRVQQHPILGSSRRRAPLPFILMESPSLPSQASRLHRRLRQRGCGCSVIPPVGIAPEVFSVPLVAAPIVP